MSVLISYQITPLLLVVGYVGLPSGYEASFYYTFSSKTTWQGEGNNFKEPMYWHRSGDIIGLTLCAADVSSGDTGAHRPN